MKYNYQIAIDGPAGSGKSTVAKLLAKKLGLLYMDSGAMYRAITLYLIQKKIAIKKINKFKKHFKKIKIDFMIKKDKQHIFLNNADVTNHVRSQKVNQSVSEVSSKKIIRNEIDKRLRQFAMHCSVVMDGRDIGTNVFKNANLKIYLTASCEIRAKRRMKDFRKMGETVSLKQLITDMQKRDNYDAARAISPLCKAQDAVVIDSSLLNINEVLNKISSFIPYLR